MKLYNFIITLVVFLLANSAQAQSSGSKMTIDDYYLLNETETRLFEYKDSDEDLRMKIEQLAVINRSRKRHRAKPLILDLHASRVANKMCKEAALNNYVGHWNLAGEKPYHRYAFSGGVDHVTENASGQMTTGRFSMTKESIAERMEEDHSSFMSEKKPDDGHKQTVIDPKHNYVGIGFYTTENQHRYYELYIDRYYEFGAIPESLKAGEIFKLRCRPQKGKYFTLLLAYYEEEPGPLSPRMISSRSYYNDYTDEIALQIAPWEIGDYRNGDWYNIDLEFDKRGLYYIQIYSDDKPYKEGSKYTSEGKLQASGIVIRVK